MRFFVGLRASEQDRREGFDRVGQFGVVQAKEFMGVIRSVAGLPVWPYRLRDEQTAQQFNACHSMSANWQSQSNVGRLLQRRNSRSFPSPSPNTVTVSTKAGRSCSQWRW